MRTEAPWYFGFVEDSKPQENQCASPRYSTSYSPCKVRSCDRSSLRLAGSSSACGRERGSTAARTVRSAAGRATTGARAQIGEATVHRWKRLKRESGSRVPRPPRGGGMPPRVAPEKYELVREIVREQPGPYGSRGRVEQLGDLPVGHVADVKRADDPLPKVQGIRPPHRRLRPFPSLECSRSNFEDHGNRRAL